MYYSRNNIKRKFPLNVFQPYPKIKMVKETIFYIILFQRSWEMVYFMSGKRVPTWQGFLLFEKNYLKSKSSQRVSVQCAFIESESFSRGELLSIYTFLRERRSPSSHHEGVFSRVRLSQKWKFSQYESLIMWGIIERSYLPYRVL